MTPPLTMPGLKGFRFPRGIIAYAVWAYHRFALRGRVRSRRFTAADHILPKLLEA